MTVKLWNATLINFFETSLANALESGASILIMASPVSGATAPGVIVVDRKDSLGNKTTSLQEFISFTTVNNQELSGLTRGLGGSTQRSHNASALIHGGITTTHWNDLLDYLEVEHTSDGHHLFSNATLNYLQGTNVALTSQASIADGWISVAHLSGGFISTITILCSINASAASVVGFPVPEPGGLPPFIIDGAIASGTNLTPYLIIENSSTLKSISALLQSPISTSSLVLDVNKNNVSLFDAGTRLSILAGGTYSSTASLAVTTLTPGNLLSLDVDNGSGGGANLTVLLET